MFQFFCFYLAGCGNEEGYRDSRPSHLVQQQKHGSALQPRFRTTSTGQQLNNLKEIGLGNSPIATRLYVIFVASMIGFFHSKMFPSGNLA